MTSNISVQNAVGYAVDVSRLRWAVTVALAQHPEHRGSALSIIITDNVSVQQLNRQYRGIDAPTDVLSFPADAPPIDIPDEPPYLGDLVIAYPYAQAQAEREGFEMGAGLALLAVHGTLHLLGYDHDTPVNRAKMWAAQDAILAALGISLQIVPRLEGDDELQT